MAESVCIQIDAAHNQVQLIKVDDPALVKSFTFDGAYFMDSTAEQIYNDIVFPLVENVLEGYNGTVFAYGQTGSGKTFSMQGDNSIPAQRGVIPRTFEHIFEATATADNRKFLVHASYLEIYNEEVRDLLGKDKNQKLEIKEHPEKGVYVAGLSLHAVHDDKQCQVLMNMGFENRHVGATLMNKDSSRSHSIFTIYIEMMDESPDGEQHIRTGKLHLVDLAGSERQAKTGATGDRFKEATKINLSLSALGNVISALVDGKSKHIPYRDSKLTRLLQDSLGGNTKTIMIACISPADNNYDETLSTLRYANRAKNIKNKPKINEDPKDALLREFQLEIERLKAMMANGDYPKDQQPKPQISPIDIEAERTKLRLEFEQSMAELREQYHNEQKSKSKLQEDLAALKLQYDQANRRIIDNGKSNSAKIGGGGGDGAEARKRLELLEQQFVGGEQANNAVLKEKRMRKKNEVERKVQKGMNAALANSDDPLSIHYNSTQERLEAVTNELQKEKRKVKSLEIEIQDLQGEFELDRLDYLETIRKQDQQLKLLQQIIDRIQPFVGRDSNYATIERIKRDAVWNDDQGRWILPEVTATRTTLPNAAIASTMMMMPGGRAGAAPLSPRGMNGTNGDEESRLRKRLEKSQEENLANTYFKPFRTAQVAQKYLTDRTRNIGTTSSFPKRLTAFDNLLSGVIYTDDIYDRPSSDTGNGGYRKPQRLEALGDQVAAQMFQAKSAQTATNQLMFNKKNNMLRSL